jgi:hypothetical protein
MIAKTVLAQSKRADQARQKLRQGKQSLPERRFETQWGTPTNSPVPPQPFITAPSLPLPFRTSQRETAASLRCRPCQACRVRFVAVARGQQHHGLADGNSPHANRCKVASPIPRKCATIRSEAARTTPQPSHAWRMLRWTEGLLFPLTALCQLAKSSRLERRVTSLGPQQPTVPPIHNLRGEVGLWHCEATLRQA